MKTEEGTALDVRCKCIVCSGHIIVPPGHAGETIICPHCGMETVLYEPPQELAERPNPPAIPANLRTCAGCGGSVSRNAQACPHCGALTRPRHGVFYYVVIGTISLIGTCVILLFIAALLGIPLDAHSKQQGAQRKARAGLPPELTLSEPQQRDLENGHVFTPEEIEAIRGGRTAGFEPWPKPTPQEKAAGKAIKILSWGLDRPKKVGGTYFSDLRVELENTASAWGHGFVWLIGYDRKNQKRFEETYYFGVPPNTRKQDKAKVVLDSEEAFGIKEWAVTWEPDEK